MKIYIFADMEGISGICGSTFVSWESMNFPRARELMTREANLCVDACFAAGADEVIVRDGHGGGLNMLWEEFDCRAQLVQGDTPGVRFAGIEGSDGVILLGYHAMAGTPGAHLEHTYSSATIQNLWMNGRRVGEFAIDCVIAGEHGVPVIMTSGCDKLAAEARDFSPEVVTCEVKRSLSLQGTLQFPADQVEEAIRCGVKLAVRKMRAGAIPTITCSPVTLRSEWVERKAPSRYGGRIGEVTRPTAEEAFYALF